MKKKAYEVLTPTRKQLEFLQSDARFKAFIGGVGSGKTKIGDAAMLEYVIKYPGCFTMIGAPTYPMLRDATRRTFFELCPEEYIKDFSRSNNEAELINGSRIIFRSLDDPQKLRGPNLAAAFLDEASLCRELSMKIVQGRVRQPGFPNKIWIAGNPNGFNWVYRMFAETKRENYFLVQASTYDNPHLPSDYVASLEESYSGSFARAEIHGEFVAHEGLVYPEFSQQVHVLDDFPIQQKKQRAYVGIDFGYTNPAAMLLFTLDSDDRVWIWREFYERKVLVEDQIKQLKAWKAEGFDLQMTFPDPSEPGFIQQIINAGFPAQPADNAIMEGVQEVTRKIAKKEDGRPALFVLGPSCPNLIKEFMTYAYPEGKDGVAKNEKPAKQFDHAMDALRYGIMGVRQQERFFVSDYGF